MDEDYGSLAHDGAPLLHVPLCVSRVFLFLFVVQFVLQIKINFVF